MFRLLLTLLFLSFIAAPAAAVQLAPAGPSAREGYLLGPQDRLMIRVHSLRRTAGDIIEWGALTGEFTVGADGRVSLPIIGSVAAAGIAPAELAESIAGTLREAADLSDLPSASVEVVRHRPFYVLGAVQQPGSYEFAPGLIVLQAVGIAQGLARPVELSTAERDMLAWSGELRALEAEGIALGARMARLVAEIEGAEAVTFPEALLSRASSDPRAAAAMSSERLRFAARRDGLEAELIAIEESKVLLRQELGSLEEKGRSLDRQLEANAQELRAVSDLVERGLAVSPRQLAAENARAAVENSRLDVQVASLRAQQALTRASRDMIELRSRLRRGSLDEAAVTRAALDQNAERRHTVERLRAFAEASWPGIVDPDDQRPVYRLTRRTAAGLETWNAEEGDPVEPGDVLQVAVPRTNGGNGARLNLGTAFRAMPR